MKKIPSHYTPRSPYCTYFNTIRRIMVSATAAPRRTTKVNIRLLSIASLLYNGNIKIKIR